MSVLFVGLQGVIADGVLQENSEAVGQLMALA